MKKKNKILILTGIFPPDIGGPATQLDALARQLTQNGLQIQILTFGRSDKIKYPYNVKKVSNKLLYLMHGFLLAIKSDILYSQDLYTAGLTGLLAKIMLRKPLVTRFVGDSAWETAFSRNWISDDIVMFQEKKYSWQVEARKKIRKYILLKSDKVIVVSFFLKDLAQRIGVPENKINVIYNSIDFLDIKAGVTSKEKIKKKLNYQGLVMVTIARLVPWKGIDMLIEIMPDLISRYRDISLVVLGQGPQMDKLKKLVQKLGLENNVFLRGKTDRQATIEFLYASDLFVLNTNYEGMSHCLLEAMKIEVPIITTKTGGNPETIIDGQTGLLVEYRNKQQWLRAIYKMLDNKDKAADYAIQAKKDLNRFNWRNLVKETINIFQDL